MAARPLPGVPVYRFNAGRCERIPDAVPASAGVRTSCHGLESDAVTNQFLQALRILSGAFIGALAVIAGAMVLVAPETVVPEPWVIAVLLGLVAVATILGLVMVGQVPAASPGDTLRAMASRVQSVHIMRLAITEAPAMLAIVLTFLTDEPSWVTVAIASVPTIVLMLLFVYPHQGVLRRYERALDDGGARTQFTDKLLGRVA